jgi:hypothetical protein
MGAPTDTAGPRRDHHGRIGGNALRASVLGANDGLVSNLSLVTWASPGPAWTMT